MMDGAAGGERAPAGVGPSGAPSPRRAPAHGVHGHCAVVASSGSRLTVPPRQTEPFERRLFGKPLRWSRGWVVLLVVWAAVGALLLVARLDMGHLTAWSANEATAVAQVRAFKPDGVHGIDELLGLLANELTTRMGAGSDVPRWYAFERSWEDRVYVVWEWSPEAALWFTVENGAVHPDDEARLILRTVARSLPSH